MGGAVRIRDCILIFEREWIHIKKSDRTTIAFLALLFCIWGFYTIVNFENLFNENDYMQMMIFSLIIIGNFVNNTFIFERASGCLEILLVSGVSRYGLFLGKIIFCTVISSLFGLLCMALSLVVATFAVEKLYLDSSAISKGLVVFTLTCFYLSSWSAWLSLIVKNPRIVHFVNILLLSGAIGLYYSLVYRWENNFMILIGEMVSLSAIGIIGTMWWCKKENISEPIVY